MSDETANLSALLRGVFEHSPTAIYMHDTAGRWVFANAECCRALGISPAAIASHTPVRDTLPPRLADAVLRNDHAVIAYGEVISVHENVLDPDSHELRKFLSVKFPVRDADGAVIGAGVSPSTSPSATGPSVICSRRRRSSRLSSPPPASAST